MSIVTRNEQDARCHGVQQDGGIPVNAAMREDSLPLRLNTSTTTSTSHGSGGSRRCGKRMRSPTGTRGLRVRVRSAVGSRSFGRRWREHRSKVQGENTAIRHCGCTAFFAIISAMKATMQIPDELYREVKAKSALEGRSVRSVTVMLYGSWLRGLVPDPKCLRRASFVGGVLASCRQIQAFSCDG